jgi:hypothetical protein
MHPTAPVLHYVLHDDFTPAHRAKLSKSHKKVEQLLGVTPSLKPVPPPAPPRSIRTRHRRSQSFAAPPSPVQHRTRTKSNARERGKLANIFEISGRPTAAGDRESMQALMRVSTDSSSSSSSSSSSDASSPSDSDSVALGAGRGTRYPRHRPPRLNLSCSNIPQSLTKVIIEASPEDAVLDISPVSRPAVLDRVDIIDSPMSSLFRVELGKTRSRVSIIQEREFNKSIQGVYFSPSHPTRVARSSRTPVVRHSFPPHRSTRKIPQA